MRTHVPRSNQPILFPWKELYEEVESRQHAPVSESDRPPQQRPIKRRLSSGTVFTPILIDGRAGCADSHHISYHILPPGGATHDPRLGVAQQMKKLIYQRDGLGNPDDDVPADFDYEDPPPYIDDNIPLSSITTYSFLDPDAPPSQPFVQKTLDYFKDQQRKKLNRDILLESIYLRKQDCTCAEEAVRLYNQINGEQYQIVETLGSYERRVWGRVWFHCNFRAVDPRHSSIPRLFFGELYLEDAIIFANSCLRLDIPNLHIVRGCEVCGDQLSHPADLFEVGY